MKNDYELWLDESGDFDNEQEKKAKRWSPSLIGGVLLEKSDAESLIEAQLIDMDRNHACDLTKIDKREYVLPVLEEIKEKYGGHEVFFENQNYEEGTDNNQLYLYMMAEGLLRLLQKLSAENESVLLEVLIAQRQKVVNDEAQGRIKSDKYEEELRRLIEKKKKEHKIILNENTKFTIEFEEGTQDVRLCFADFACNTRLTRTSWYFEGLREKVNALYEKEYIFPMYEMSSENYILRSLTQGSISDAVFELYTSRDDLNKDALLDLILKRIKRTNHRLIKSQFRQSAGDIAAYAALQDDYEIGEAFLCMIKDHFIKRIKKEQIPCSSLEFAVRLQLIDMYLREGDIQEARREIAECEVVQAEMGNHLEDVFTYYQLIEKKAILYIDEFDYKRAADLMEAVCKVYESIMALLPQETILKDRFDELKSEYYGDALCMWIYALMFMQRSQPDLYESMCSLSDKALMQYAGDKGELERHRQYRSHIESENGNYENALKWLMQSKTFIWEENISEENLAEFLNQVYENEVEIGALYYLMYYLIIMSEAKKARHKVADTMYSVLVEEEELLNLIGWSSESQSSQNAIEIPMDDVKESDSGIKYHPLEIVHWKLATYFYESGKYWQANKEYFKAEKICYFAQNYLTIYITGFAISAEKICCLKKMKKLPEAEKEFNQLVNRMNVIRKKTLQVATAKIVDEIYDEVCSCKKTNIDYERLWRISRKITY